MIQEDYIEDVCDMEPGTRVTLVAKVVAVDFKTTKKDAEMAVVTVDDQCVIDVVVFPVVLESCKQLLEVNEIIKITGKVEEGESGPLVIAETLSVFTTKDLGV